MNKHGIYWLLHNTGKSRIEHY